MVIDPSGAYFRPEGDGYICGIAPSLEDDVQCHDFIVQHHLFEEVLWPLLAARVPGFEALRLKRSWAGHYDMNTLDQNVIVGLHPEVDNLLFANGFSGHGLPDAPNTQHAQSSHKTAAPNPSPDTVKQAAIAPMKCSLRPCD
jgi:glycine/D-amino acid oxidase-like deaminating enzyme